MFRLRFDLRTPPFTTVTHAQQYQEMVAMVKWADERGFSGATVSEHHGTDDGFMSSPILIAGAILAATRAMTCGISALLVPYHDPLRLAEDIAAVDLMAPGRLAVVLGLAGLGRIGKAVATRAAAFEMRVIAYDPVPDAAFCAAHGIGLVSFDELLRGSDFLSLHLPLTPATRHVMNAAA